MTGKVQVSAKMSRFLNEDHLYPVRHYFPAAVASVEKRFLKDRLNICLLTKNETHSKAADVTGAAAEQSVAKWPFYTTTFSL